MLEYFKERYPVLGNYQETADIYREWLLSQNCFILDRPYGFISYKFEGDACIIYDIYTVKQFRNNKGAWKLFKEVLAKIQINPACKVIIGFSEKAGINHLNGIGAMLAAEFIKAYELKDKTVYIRGIQ